MRLKQNFWSIIGLYALFGFNVFGQGFKDKAPQFHYDTLPKTSFSCQGQLAGRYYADPETDCQLFHVCVRMNAREIQDFKFLCPNGTSFDQEHQVCMDYYQVVCHEGIGTNPLGSNYELMKLSSLNRNDDLVSGKYSFIDPDVAEKNTLGDDFQVDEYNNNRLASSQNSLGQYQSSKSRGKSSDIFYKSFQASTKYTTSSTTPRQTRPTTTTTTSSTTPVPLVFRSPISTSLPSKSLRRPSLETFESYEIESVNGFGPQNSFGQQSYQNYDGSYENQDTYSSSPSASTTSTTTTRRPEVFQSTFRTSFPNPSSTSLPPGPQTFQQQATRFNDDFFKKLSVSTETSVPRSSKTAQFYINSNTPYISSSENRQPSTNSIYRTTTEIPNTTARYSQSPENGQYRVIKVTDAPSKQLFSAKTSDRGLSNRGSSSSSFFTGSPNIPQTSTENLRHSTFFVPPQSNSDEGDKPQTFSAKIIAHSQPSEDFIRPRSFSGTSNANNNQVNRQSNRDNFGFSTISPPTTAEPSASITDFPTSEVTNSRGSVLFQRITTLKPEKFSIFFTKSTAYANKEYTDKPTRFPTTNSVYDSTPTTTYRPPTTTTYPQENEQKKKSIGSFDSGRIKNHSDKSNYVSTTEYFIPESTTTDVPFTTTTDRPVRRGVRRRINRTRQQNQREFDPEFKYSRRFTENATAEFNKQKIETVSLTRNDNNDEIFNAEASVFPGRPKANLFQDERKGQTPTENKEEAVKETTKSEQPIKLSESYGRRIRPTLREQFVRNKHVESQDTKTLEKQEKPTPAPEQQTQRRLIKRLKVKVSTTTSTTPEPEVFTRVSSSTSHATSTTTKAPVSSTQSSLFNQGSTLRPVKRISVKTKVIGTRKLEKDFDSKVISTSSTRNPFSAFEKLKKLSISTSTTPEPELITASDDEILKKKNKKLSTPFSYKEITTPTTYRPSTYSSFNNNAKKNSTSVIIKVTKKQEPFPTPISFKEPILNHGKFDKKESRVEVKESIREESSITKSPDYDYAYYNTDNDDDYTNVEKLADSKSYGKKPNNNRKISLTASI